MFRISRLHEIMKGLPRGRFDRLVETHRADKHAEGFGCWDQLVAVYAQLSGASSLRVLESGFNSQGTHHYHLGTGTVRRSTLADALARRKTTVFAEAARLLMAQAGRRLQRDGGELLYALDSTSITLSITAPNVNDIDAGTRLPIEPGAVYVFDKGYCDYNGWARIEAQKTRFVTRFKRNAALRVERALPIPTEDADAVLHDEIVRFANKQPRGGRKNHHTQPLRRITVARPEHDSPLVLATNDLDSAARSIAQRYGDRWQIELFFKWIKQHLRIKTFLWRSENAVRLQVLTALITYLLHALYRKAETFTGSLWALLAEVRATLFQRPTIEAEQYRRRKEASAEIASRQGGLFA